MGNKIDDPDKKVVPKDEAQHFADQIGIQLYETSAKDNINIEEVCTCVCACGCECMCLCLVFTCVWVCG